MTHKDAVSLVDWFDRNGEWLLPYQRIRAVRSKESDIGVKRSLARMVHTGVVHPVARGLYANPRASSKPLYALESVAAVLKPRDISYLSLESVLSEHSIISQMPMRLTFMTTGRSQTFKTSYGVVEFVHSKRPRDTFLEETFFDEQRKINVAVVKRAYQDLKNVNRNLDLVDLDMLREALND